MKRKRKPARIVPIVSAKPGHEGNVVGWQVHPDDRAVRTLPTPPEKVSAEPDDDSGTPA